MDERFKMLKRAEYSVCPHAKTVTFLITAVDAGDAGYLHFRITLDTESYGEMGMAKKKAFDFLISLGDMVSNIIVLDQE